MDGFFKRTGGWFAAALITVVLGVFFQTQNVLARLNEIGADVGLADRLKMTGYDVLYLGKPYFIFVGISLAISFWVASFVFRFVKFGRPIIYSVAGAVAIFVMLYAMKEVFFKIPAIAGARDGLGIGLQMLAGAIGGFVFSKINRPELKSETKSEPLS